MSSTENETTAQIVMIDAALIEPNKGQIEGLPKNPRLIRNDAYRKLVDSLERDPEFFTKLNPLKVYPHGGKYVIMGGNMRYHASRDKRIADSWGQLPCLIIPEETDNKTLERYILLDNASFGEWDPDEMANWDTELLDQFCIDMPGREEETEEEAKEDNYDTEGNRPTEAKAKTHPGDIYQLGKHRLICGDSTDPSVLQRLVGTDVVDLLITDPPLQRQLPEQEHRQEDRERQHGRRRVSGIPGGRLHGRQWSDEARCAFLHLARGQRRLQLQSRSTAHRLDGTPMPHLEQEQPRPRTPGLSVETRAMSVRMEGRSQPLLHAAPRHDDSTRDAGKGRPECHDETGDERHAPDNPRQQQGTGVGHRLRQAQPQRRPSDNEAAQADGPPHSEQQPPGRNHPRQLRRIRQHHDGSGTAGTHLLYRRTRPDILRRHSQTLGGDDRQRGRIT